MSRSFRNRAAKEQTLKNIDLHDRKERRVSHAFVTVARDTGAVKREIVRSLDDSVHMHPGKPGNILEFCLVLEKS